MNKDQMMQDFHSAALCLALEVEMRAFEQARALLTRLPEQEARERITAVIEGLVQRIESARPGGVKLGPDPWRDLVNQSMKYKPDWADHQADDLVKLIRETSDDLAASAAIASALRHIWHSAQGLDPLVRQ